MGKYRWLLQAGLTLFFLIPTITKLNMPKEEMVAKSNTTANQPVYFPRFSGFAELSGILVMIASIWVEELKFLAGTAALGFALVVVVASGIHARKNELRILSLLAFVLATTTAFFTVQL